MRAALLLFGIILSGCGAYPTLEELETQALASGDWSRVAQREKILRERALRSANGCGSGQVGYCETYFGRESCQCVDSDVMRQFFAGR